ncbi:MAG: 4-alpha-glucanotransferase [Clostridia bacterium]|nr:4-alpha-glucanotransferase [Clostridia bacterium]
MLLRDELPKRKSGILLPLSSLPSDCGIGTLGMRAYEFIDLLCDTKQKYWQMLPLVPLGEGNSPYKSPSCFAGEILYIDLDILAHEGLLSLSKIKRNEVYEKVDYKAVKKYKIPLIKEAAENFDTEKSDYKVFLSENAYWLDSYAVFMTALEIYNTEFLTDIPDFILKKQGEDYKTFINDNEKTVRFYKIAQYFFYAQYFELKRYAKQKGIMLIGDIPFYVSPDSADVWSNPENFLVDENFVPKLVAGVPPDYFSATGQLWGNPVYNFEHLRKTGYGWWIKRLKHYFKVFDVVRIDHFRAFADYYTIPFGNKDATEGKWETGVGMDFWQTAEREIKNMKIIAEDLGADSKLVKELVSQTGFPNMKVLQFGICGQKDNPHNPENYGENCVLYTGTHDNNTMLGYYNETNDYEKRIIESINPELEIPLNMIKFAMDTSANTVIIPISDYLMLDENSRINVPGIPKGNWEFRLKRDYISDSLKTTILNIARK